MSLARAFTTKRNKMPSVDSQSPARAQSTRKPIKRSDISGPVALISTTNMLSYNAPDISSYRHASSGSSSASSHSSLDSDAKSTSSAHDTTDASSVGSSPISPKPNHLSSYLEQATNVSSKAASPVPSTPAIPAQSPRRSRSITDMQQRSIPEEKPVIPQRALSHSKRAHEHLARQRSLRNSSSSPRLSHESREQRSSADIFKINDDPSHPFGKELEQLKEVVEEFGGVVSEASNDEDAIFMRTRRLAKFNAADYMKEIQPLYAGIFHKQVVAIQAGWI